MDGAPTIVTEMRINPGGVVSARAMVEFGSAQQGNGRMTGRSRRVYR
jgi:hypothetical protein